MLDILNRSVILNIILAFVLAGLLVLFTSLFLRFYTKHEKVAFLPVVTETDFNKAYDVLDSLRFDVEVDSTYNPKYKAGQIISQLPKGGREVKYKRNVLLVYNKYIRPTVNLPNFLNLTLRSASILLKKNMLIMGDTVFKHDITKGIILEQWVNGRKLNPGTEIPVGVKVSFVVSSGLGEPNIPLRLLVGKSYPEMMQYMRMNELNPQILWTGSITDTGTAKVYMQYPMHINNYNQVNYVAAGEYINISIMQNPSDSLLKIYSHVEIIPLPREDVDEYNSYDFSYKPGARSSDKIIDLTGDIENDMDRERIEQKIEEQLSRDMPQGGQNGEKNPDKPAPIGPQNQAPQPASKPENKPDKKPKSGPSENE